MLKIVAAETNDDIQNARSLFEEYASSLDFELDFQGFKDELTNLPGDYTPPDGRLLLAFREGKLAGCVALRRIENGICEMKRLFVRPEFQGQRIGRLLAEAIIGEARRLGYICMRLDTVPVMERARTLYSSLGFRVIPAYRYNPIPGAVFMELHLGGGNDPAMKEPAEKPAVSRATPVPADLPGLQKLLRKHGLPFPKDFSERTERYCKLILEWNERASLVSAKDEARLIEHFADSLSLLAVEPHLGGKSLLDIGSGAGFPGLVLKLWADDLDVVLLESNRKKALFLKKAIDALGLNGAAVAQERYEDYSPDEKFDLITLRAIKNADAFLGKVATLLKVGGKYVHYTTERRVSADAFPSSLRNSFEVSRERAAWGRGILAVYKRF
jgi:putative acetyltransferase